MTPVLQDLGRSRRARSPRRARRDRIDVAAAIAPFVRIDVDQDDGLGCVRASRVQRKPVTVQLEGAFLANELVPVARRLLRIALTEGATNAAAVARAIEMLEETSEELIEGDAGGDVAGCASVAAETATRPSSVTVDA